MSLARKLVAVPQGLMRFIRLPAQARADVFRAGFELARARFRLHRIAAGQIASMDDPATAAPGTADIELATRVKQAIGRTARIVPWRSDCLVQALAARHWLTRLGVPTRLRLGARSSGGSFRPDAHAWLLCGDLVVTGGNIAGFRPFSAASERRA